MTQDKRRDELMKELEKEITITFNSKSPNNLFKLTFEQIADFILRREEAILSEIEKPLKVIGCKMPQNSWDKEFTMAIDEALSIISKMRGK